MRCYTTGIAPLYRKGGSLANTIVANSRQCCSARSAALPFSGKALPPRAQPRQSAGENRISTVNSSRRPSSIAADNNHFAPSGSDSNVPDGPTMGPKAGPTLQIAVAALDTAVTKSRPSIPSPTATSAKQTPNTKKKLSTEKMTSSGMGLPL